VFEKHQPPFGYLSRAGLESTIFVADIGLLSNFNQQIILLSHGHISEGVVAKGP